jgi:membrane fusion protein, multidrug efflux system
MKDKKKIKRVYNAVIIVLLVAAVVYAFSNLVHWGGEYTDDAQVQRHITPIHTRVQGFIKEIRFEEYQHVKKGDTLVVLEDAEYRLQLAQAEANWRGSKSGTSAISAGMNTTASNVQVASAGIEEAKVNMQNAQDDYERYEALLQKRAVTRQQYDNARAKYEAAKARYAQASASRQSAALVKDEQQQLLTQNTAGVSVAEAAVNLALLNLSYTVIVATADGVMGRKEIHEGQLVQPGQMLARIVDDDQVWVIANYRETQLKNIAAGDHVRFTADALPGVVFNGTVQSFSPATGAAYSTVAADNATGNFVKVEQRVPVRITLTADNKPADVEKLKAGLNVECKVKQK